jgi:membrane protein involved in colicin uptake
MYVFNNITINTRMERNERNTQLNNRESGNNLGWIIAVVVILGLILMWVLFSNAGEDQASIAAQEAAEEARQNQAAAQREAEDAQDASAEVATETRLTAARAEARADLLALRAELEADAAYEDAEADIAEIERNLAAAYANASGQAQAGYQDIQQILSSLGDSIRDQTGDALEALSELSLMLEADVRAE